MQRIQNFKLLSAICLVVFSGCSQQQVPTVADYMHDIDAAEQILKLYKSDPSKYSDDPRVKNASKAKSELHTAREFGSPLSKCWTSKPPTTAGTDHACLDINGFKR